MSIVVLFHDPDVQLANHCQNLDNNSVITHHDTSLRLFLSNHNSGPRKSDRESVLLDLQKSWSQYEARKSMDERTWIQGLEAHLTEIIKRRTDHVEIWIETNLKRFKSARANLENVQREVANAIVDIQTNVEMCKFSCSRCNLSCTFSRKHDPNQLPHNCGTDHICALTCDYAKDHRDEMKLCRSP